MRSCEDCLDKGIQRDAAYKVRHVDSNTLHYVCGHCNMHGGRYCTIERLFKRMRKVAQRKVQPLFQSYAVHWD